MEDTQRVRKCIPGTGREIVGRLNGVRMQRAFVYLPHSTWDKLREMGRRHGVSDSIILEQLVEIASATA